MVKGLKTYSLTGFLICPVGAPGVPGEDLIVINIPYLQNRIILRSVVFNYYLVNPVNIEYIQHNFNDVVCVQVLIGAAIGGGLMSTNLFNIAVPAAGGVINGEGILINLPGQYNFNSWYFNEPVALQVIGMNSDLVTAYNVHYSILCEIEDL